MNEENYIFQNLIEKFFAGELSAEEERTFKKQLHDSDNLRDAKFHAAYLKVLKEKGQQNTLKKLLIEREAQLKPIAELLVQEPIKDTKGTSTIKKLWKDRPLYILRWAAGFLILISVVSVLWANYKFSYSAIAQELHEAISPNILLGISDQEMAFKQGKEEFKNKNYKAAKELLIRINRENESYYESQCLLAYCYFQLEEYNQSIKAFDLIIENIDSLPNHYQNQDQLLWDRLLAYLGNNQLQTEAFQNQLKLIKERSNTYYVEKVKHLEKKLKSPWRLLVFD